jgi:DNA repair protein RadC
MSERTKRIDIVTIQMVKEASLRYQYRKISNPDDVKSLVLQLLEKKDREYFGVICLDTKNQPTHIMTVSVGTLNSSIVHPREVFKSAILSNSASVILFHNHPSGNPEPSGTDMEITRRLIEAGTIIGINVIDHVIVGDEEFLSMKEKMMI